jgi:hypothetical protein
VLTSLNFTSSAHWNESPQNWWIFAISPNTGGSKYFPHKCGGFLKLTPGGDVLGEVTLDGSQPPVHVGFECLLRAHA